MPTDRTQARLVNLVGIVWLVVALGTLGYFAVLDTAVLRQIQREGLRPGPAPVKHLLPSGATKGSPLGVAPSSS
jgi:hypothetical protein